MTDEPVADPEDGEFGTKKTIKTEAISNQGHLTAYWHRNLKYLAILLSIWFIVSYGCGILFADALNAYTIPGTGFKWGFWFGQQGSIYVFVILIWVYVYLMNKLDKEFGLDEGE